MRCSYCRYDQPSHLPPHKHATSCPEAPDLVPEQAKKLRDGYWIGYKDGRSGKQPHALDKDIPVYMLGWGNGVVALEEAENGYNPYGPGGDPGPEG